MILFVWSLPEPQAMMARLIVEAIASDSPVRLRTLEGWNSVPERGLRNGADRQKQLKFQGEVRRDGFPAA